MYKIPENFNISQLKGEVIFQIAFGLNFVSLFFDKGYINIEGSFFISINNQKNQFNVYPIQNDFGLLQLLEKKIIEAETNIERDRLVLLFENEYSIELVGDIGYESYTIRIGEDEIIV
jgi:hypothetical protein